MAKWILDGGNSKNDSSDIDRGIGWQNNEFRESVLEAKRLLEREGEFLVIPKEKVNQNIRGWRVCIGYFDDFNEAKEVAKEAKDRGVKGVYIMPNLK